MPIGYCALRGLFVSENLRNWTPELVVTGLPCPGNQVSLECVFLFRSSPKQNHDDPAYCRANKQREKSR